ncbi:MAG: GAF domain-containing protein [Erysipelotrichaceae bacterium]|nr:GAF domain-containing protein [Erysipelotrichaceae bacterium]
MKQDYEMMSKQITSLAEISNRCLPVLANASAILYDALPDLNWAGFYLVEEEHLILGPFQGKFACVRIEKGKGVCGTAYAADQTQVVPDVHQFPGHIACDSASNSEIVIPLHTQGKVVAVMDIDSPMFDRFSVEDVEGLSDFARTLEEIICWE